MQLVVSVLAFYSFSWFCPLYPSSRASGVIWGEGGSSGVPPALARLWFLAVAPAPRAGAGADGPFQGHVSDTTQGPFWVKVALRHSGNRGCTPCSTCALGREQRGPRPASVLVQPYYFGSGGGVAFRVMGQARRKPSWNSQAVICKQPF